MCTGGSLTTDFRITFSVLSTAPEKTLPLEASTQVTLPSCLARIWAQFISSMFQICDDKQHNYLKDMGTMLARRS